MKKDHVLDEQEPGAASLPGADPEIDDPEASDLLDLIAKDGEGEEKAEPEAEPVKKDGPFALESMYFRSFGSGTLLTREQEVALAKRVDEGSRDIRLALKEAIAVAGRMKRTERVEAAMLALVEIRRLSGLAATDVDQAEQLLTALIQEARGTGKVAAYRVKLLSRSLRQVRTARVVLERAKDELVRRNLRLVVDIAKRYNGRGLGLLDLVQEGNIGLMKATERFKYRKGFKFSTYATWWIRQGITRALADQSRTIRIPVHLTEASQRITRTARRLVQALGREPQAAEIGQALRVAPARIEETMQAFQEPVSLDNPVSDGETSLGDMIPDRLAVQPDTNVHKTERAKEMERILSTLTPREQTVIRLRFGIEQDEAWTLEQVGQSLSVTRERIRQIEAKALKKLKTPAVREMFEAIR
jgi:RNA polymerase primary sigma factor